MAGRPQRKIFCQALRRRDNKPCQAKGFMCANGKHLCRFHGYNNILGFNKPNYSDDTRINQLSKLKQFRDKTREQLRDYYFKILKPRLTSNQKSIYHRRAFNSRKNTNRVYIGQNNKPLTDQLDAVLQHLKKKS